MSARELALAVALVAAACMVVVGMSMWSEAVAWVVAGLLTAALAVVFLTEVGDGS